MLINRRKDIILNKIHVDTKYVGKRIDAYLAETTELSRTNIQRLIENKKILVNECHIKYN